MTAQVRVLVEAIVEYGDRGDPIPRRIVDFVRGHQLGLEVEEAERRRESSGGEDAEEVRHVLEEPSKSADQSSTAQKGPPCRSSSARPAPGAPHRPLGPRKCAAASPGVHC